MRLVVQAGRAAVAVAAAAVAVDLLSAAAAGISMAGVQNWTLTIETTANVTIKVYIASGPNCALALVTNWTVAITTAAPYTLQVSDSALLTLRVTADGGGAGDAVVSCDLMGTGA